MPHGTGQRSHQTVSQSAGRPQGFFGERTTATAVRYSAGLWGSWLEVLDASGQEVGAFLSWPATPLDVSVLADGQVPPPARTTRVAHGRESGVRVGQLGQLEDALLRASLLSGELSLAVHAEVAFADDSTNTVQLHCYRVHLQDGVSVPVLPGPVDLPVGVDDQVVSGATVELQVAARAARVLDGLVGGVVRVVGHHASTTTVLLLGRRGAFAQFIGVRTSSHRCGSTRPSVSQPAHRRLLRAVAARVVVGIFGAGVDAARRRRHRSGARPRRRGDQKQQEHREEHHDQVPASRQRHA